MDNAQFIILNAGAGKRIKSYGNKCLLVLPNGLTIIEYQLKQLYKFFKNCDITIVVGFESEKVIKNIEKINKKYKFNISFVENTEYNHTNDSASLLLALESIKKSSYVIYGDLIFDGLDIFIPTNNTIFTCERQNIDEIGISEKDVFKNICWNMCDQYAQMLFITSKSIDRLNPILKSNSHKFIFENLQELVNSENPPTFHISKISKPTFDIDCPNDIKLADKYIEYSNN
jgi:choline kinase